MCLPLVSWSSVALATQHVNSNKVKAAFLIVSHRFQFSADTVKMLIEAEIRLNQRDPAEYVKAEITKNETFKVEMKQPQDLPYCLTLLKGKYGLEKICLN